MWVKVDDPDECEKCFGTSEYWYCAVYGSCDDDYAIEYGCGPIECDFHERWVWVK